MQKPEIDVSHLFSKIEKVMEIYEVLWGNDSNSIINLYENIYHIVMYSLQYAFFDNLHEIFALERSSSSGLTLYKFMTIMEEYVEKYSTEIKENAKAKKYIKLLNEEYEKYIKDIIVKRLKPLRNKLFVHLDKDSNDELSKEMENLKDYDIDYNCFIKLMIFAENVVWLTNYINNNKHVAARRVD